MSKSIEQLVERAKKDRNFLYELLADPAEATREYDLSEDQRRALVAQSPDHLATLVSLGFFGVGCELTPTCNVTCPLTCARTLPSARDSP